MNSCNFLLVCLLIISVIASVSSFRCCYTTYISPQPSKVDVICSDNFDGCMMVENYVDVYFDNFYLVDHNFQPNTSLLFDENQTIIKYYEYILRPSEPVQCWLMSSQCLIEKLISNGMIDSHYHVMMSFSLKDENNDNYGKWIYLSY